MVCSKRKPLIIVQGLNSPSMLLLSSRQGSKLEKIAKEDSWITHLPMWDWVGGRTSELSAVGLLPAALQGLDIGCILRGAANMDSATRVRETKKNPAALIALMWYYSTDAKGAKDMVVLPYKDRLILFSKYLQQLVMSLWARS